MGATYHETTLGIEILIEPEFIPENSNPKNHYYFFAYHVQIRNAGEQSAKLVNRHWIIRDGQGMESEVRGEGVVGHQPILKPGESFQYTSFCPLPTPTGNMRGNFEMILQSGEKVQVRIPLFFLRDLRPVPSPRAHGHSKPLGVPSPSTLH